MEFHNNTMTVTRECGGTVAATAAAAGAGCVCASEARANAQDTVCNCDFLINSTHLIVWGRHWLSIFCHHAIQSNPMLMCLCSSCSLHDVCVVLDGCGRVHTKWHCCATRYERWRSCHHFRLIVWKFRVHIDTKWRLGRGRRRSDAGCHRLTLN